MRVLVQRSTNASVTIDGKVVGSIDNGMVIFVGFTFGDNDTDISYMINKLLHLRIFDDENGVMNKNIIEMGGSILSISQFTLYADTKKGNRPSYVKALPADEATILFDRFNEMITKEVTLEKGIFGENMKVSLINDGPVTIILESRSNND